MTINETIFRLYDIRGSSISDITPVTAYKIGFCFSKMNGKQIIVGRDGRLSSPTIYHALVHGIISAGGEVTSIGIVPSPMLYFADKIFNPQASIMITASHNPKDDNGFKMLSSGRSFFDQQIQDLLHNILKTNWSNIIIPEKTLTLSTISKINITNQYLDRILQGITIDPKIKIAWDPANGAAGELIKLLTSRLPNKNIVINCQIDGNFPSHPPDPSISENLQQLIEVVKTENCDIGIAFDGDADRIAIVSKKGQVLLGEQILSIFAKDIIGQNPNSTIIMDIKSSREIFNQIKSYGGNPIMCKTGHCFIKEKMLATRAVLGGEVSGHIFFADKYYGYDDAIYAALRFMDLLSRSDRNLNDMIDKLPKCYSFPEIRISVTDNRKFTIIRQIKEELTSKNIVFNDIDGIRVHLPNSWWLIRCSNTEAKIIVRYGANNLIDGNNIKRYLLSLLNKYIVK